MNNRKAFAPPVVGGSALLVMFAVLCLTVFALLGLSTVRADSRLSEHAAQAVEEYYAADRQAEEIFARLRAGQLPEGVNRSGDLYCYACDISDTQVLLVCVQKTPEDWTVLQWQAVSSTHWQEDDSLELWDGLLPQ